MSQLTIRGSVSLEGGEFPIAGVTVVAAIPSDEEAEDRSSHQPVRMQIGRVVTDSDGSFTIETDADDQRISRWACALRHCSDFKFRLACFDDDETLLHETSSAIGCCNHKRCGSAMSPLNWRRARRAGFSSNGALRVVWVC